MSLNPQTVRQDIPAGILQGLQYPQKKIPSKFFYDERGSSLFEQITRLPEYYLTRTEMGILETNIGDITSCLGEKPLLMELGSGSSKKTRLLLNHARDIAAYVPVDISEEYLLNTARQLSSEYPDLNVHPVCADYTQSFTIPELPVDYKRTTVFFPGSTIGNFVPSKARMFLNNISDILDSNDGLLIGVDLKKDPKILHKAYNDSKGITAAFNKNILYHLNTEFGTDFDVDQFSHTAFYNEKEGRIEMHLVSQSNQKVRAGETIIDLQEGETIHTENSYKYSLDEFRELVSGLFRVKEVWTDKNDWFSVQYLCN